MGEVGLLGLVGVFGPVGVVVVVVPVLPVDVVVVGVVVVVWWLRMPPAGGVAVVVGAAGGLGSDTATIGSETFGILIWSSGVPGGTSTVTTIFWPPSRVTTSVRFWAEAGKTAKPSPAAKAASVASISRSFLIFMGAACLLPRGTLPAREPARRKVPTGGRDRNGEPIACRVDRRRLRTT